MLAALFHFTDIVAIDHDKTRLVMKLTSFIVVCFCSLSLLFVALDRELYYFEIIF